MFSVTLINLTADARTAVENGGAVDLGNLSSAELVTLLETFAELDAVQNMKADPEIRIQTRRDRFIVRTGQRKLFLYDARRLSEPAYTLSAEEIIAELDGTAAARRTAPPMAYSSVSQGEPGESAGVILPDAGETAPAPPPPPPPGRRWTAGWLAGVVVLGGYVAYSELGSRETDLLPALTALPHSERLAEDEALTGVYMTGTEPGHHGIVLLGDGRLKLFVVNARAAPGVVHGTYRLGRLDDKLCLATDQPGGLIKVLDRDALEYGGETYRKIP